MKATDVTQFFLDVPKSTSAAENPILGTWKLQSLVFEAIATGQRSSPFGDHPVGYLSYSADGRMYAIGNYFLALARRPVIRRAFIVSPCGKEPGAVLGSDGDELNLGHCLFRVRVRRTENAMN
jgi:Lipocalin-like domain